MSAALRSVNQYRHIVFTTVTPGRALDLGAGPCRHKGPRPLNLLAGVAGAERQMDETSFLAWIFRQAGLSLHDYRPASLMRRLPACLRTLRVPTISQARRALQANPQLIPIALDTLLLGVTEFFRDPPVFACLEEKLRSLAKNETGTLRVWSAACSTGAELYSVSVLLAGLGVLHRSELLGTDIRAEAVERAREGLFVSSGPLAPPRIVRAARIASRESDRMTWRQGNVLKDVEPGFWDIVLCRNMAMYLHRAAAESLWRKLATALRPGGLLVVGKAERPCSAAGFMPVGPCIYQRNES